MSLQTPAFYTAGEDHQAVGDRHVLAALLGSPAVGTPEGVTPVNVGGGHGVVGGDDLRVGQDTGANRRVTIAAGHAFVRGAKTAAQGCYAIWNDAEVTGAVELDPGEAQPRYDLIAVKVTDADYGDGATQPPEFVVIKGAAAATPVDPPVPTDGSYLVLARVRVPATPGFSVTDGIIDDLRPFAVAAGGVLVFRSTNRPTGLRPGTLGWESDTGRLVRWTGTAWQAESTFWTASAGALPSLPYAGQIAIDGPFGGGQVSRIPKFWNGSKWVSLGVGSLRWRTNGQKAGGAPADRDSQPLFVQAGHQQITTGSIGDFTITFPSPFPNGMVMARAFLAAGEAFNPALQAIPTSANQSLSSFRSRIWNTNTGDALGAGYTTNVDWFAIGY